MDYFETRNLIFSKVEAKHKEPLTYADQFKW